MVELPHYLYFFQYVGPLSTKISSYFLLFCVYVCNFANKARWEEGRIEV
jgi:hypothetical protein